MYLCSTAVVFYVVGNKNKVHCISEIFLFTKTMDDSSTLSILTLVTLIAGGIVSVLQLLEYLVTRNIPWILRFIGNLFRRSKRYFSKKSDKEERCLVLNFSGHPVLQKQQKKIRNLMGWSNLEVIDVPIGTVNEDERFYKIAIQKTDSIGLRPNEWQTIPIVVIPSGYSPLWSALLAEIHGRLGHFPDVVRLRPAPQGEKEKFEVAEILDLRDIRHQARGKR